MVLVSVLSAIAISSTVSIPKGQRRIGAGPIIEETENGLVAGLRPFCSKGVIVGEGCACTVEIRHHLPVPIGGRLDKCWSRAGRLPHRHSLPLRIEGNLSVVVLDTMVEGIVDRRGSTISTRCHVALGIITERSRTIGRHITGRIDLPPDSARLI